MKYICKSCRETYFDDRTDDERVNDTLLCHACANEFRNLIKSAQIIREQLVLHIRAMRKYS